MGIEEEYEKLIEVMRGAERSIQQIMDLDWVGTQRMKDFYGGMLHECRYCLVILDIWKLRILGKEE